MKKSKPKFKTGDIIVAKYNMDQLIKSGEIYKIIKTGYSKGPISWVYFNKRGYKKEYAYNELEFRLATPIEVMQYRMKRNYEKT